MGENLLRTFLKKIIKYPPYWFFLINDILRIWNKYFYRNLSNTGGLKLDANAKVLIVLDNDTLHKNYSSNLGYLNQQKSIKTNIVNLLRENNINFTIEISNSKKSNLSELAVKYSTYTHIFLLNVHSFVRPSIFLLVQLIFYSRVKMKQQLCFIIWDLHDPVVNSFFLALMPSKRFALLLGSVSDKANKIMMKPNFFCFEMQFLKKSLKKPVFMYDVYFPFNSKYSDRLEIYKVKELLKELNCAYTNEICIDYNDYLDLLSKCRITIVFNSVNQNYFRAFWQKSKTERHLVARNIEALLAGSVLFAQECKELDDSFQNQVHYFKWTKISDIKDLLLLAKDNWDEFETVAQRGHERIVSILSFQSRLRQFLFFS